MLKVAIPPAEGSPGSGGGNFDRVANSVRISSAPRLVNRPLSQKSQSQRINIADAFGHDKQEVEALALTSFDMWALGISIVIGGQYFAWNAGLHAGFGSLFIATFLVATGYASLVLCIAELSSALPFAGGSYGIARVTLGFYPGYLVAYIDCAESIVYVATSAYLLGEMITSISGADRSLEPVYWIVFFVTSIAIHASGGLAFWRLNRVLAVVSLAIVIVYLVGTVPHVNFDKHALEDASDPVDRWFVGGGMEFMRILPLPCWFFVGVESINLACKDMIAPKSSVPPGYIACVGTLFVTCFAILFVCCSHAPGIDVLKDELNPLNYGFARMFGISYRSATGLTLPATYATASGFMFCFGRQLRAMGQSGLTSHFLGETIPGWTTPVNALVAGSAIGLGVCFLVHYYELIGDQLFNICMLCALASYGTQFASFVVLRYKYALTIKREFVSPLGLAGAAYGFFVFLLVFIAICGFQKNFIAIVVFIVFLAVISIYYVFVAQARQFFSEEEKEVMFKAYVLKNNNARTTRLRKGRTLSARIISTQGSGSSFASSLSNSLRTWAHLGSSPRHSSRSSTRVAPGNTGSAENSFRTSAGGRHARRHSESRPNSHNTLGETEGGSDVENLSLADSDHGGAYVDQELGHCTPAKLGSRIELAAITETATEDGADIPLYSKAPITGRIYAFES